MRVPLTVAHDPHPLDPSAEIHPLLRERWSTRAFDPDHELSHDELTRLMEAARWAPSAGNSQPWAYLVGLRGDETHATFVETLSRGNTSWAPRASALLVSLHQVGHEEDASFVYSDYAAHDLGQATASLTVQAQSMGLSVHQFAGFDHAAVAAAFAVPPHWQVTTGIAVGRHLDDAGLAAADPLLQEYDVRTRDRKSFEEFVFKGRFGRPADC